MKRLLRLIPLLVIAGVAYGAWWYTSRPPTSLTLTGVVITKLDGTAKGGVLAAIALWARERAAEPPTAQPLAVYFLGVGEALEDLQTFSAREFAHALLG